MTNKNMHRSPIKLLSIITVLTGLGLNAHAADSITCISGVVVVEQKGTASVATCSTAAPAPVAPITLDAFSVESRNYLASNMVVWYAFEQKKVMVRDRPQQGIQNVPSFSFIQTLFYRDGLENGKSAAGVAVTAVEPKMMPAWTCVYPKVNTGTTWQLLDVHVANAISKGYFQVMGADASKVDTTNITSLMSIYSQQSLSEVQKTMDEWISKNIPGKTYSSIMTALKNNDSVKYGVRYAPQIKVVDNSQLIVDFLKTLNFTITNGKTVCK